MGRESRLNKHQRATYRVRTEAELIEKFRDRVMAELPPPDDSRSWDEKRAEALASGRIVEDRSGTTFQLSEKAMAALRLQREIFEFKFGRPMGPEDPIFFDWAADTPRKMDADQTIARTRAAAQEAGLDPDAAHAHTWGRDDLAAYKRGVQ